MALTHKQAADVIVASSHGVLSISDFKGPTWYRKVPKGHSRYGPWLTCKTDIYDEKRWKEKEAAIYFLNDSSNRLKYVGSTVNGISHRWRTSPSYNISGEKIGREYFHDRCWPHICNLENSGVKESYTVTSLNGDELTSVLSRLNHEIQALSCLKEDSDIVVIAIESWLIKKFKTSLWNERR